MVEKGQAKIHPLTSVRFFAALYVLFFHTSWGMPKGSLAERFVSAGFVSVEFFFLLSGFILAGAYLDKGRPIVARSFYLARFARIYPLFILTVLADTPFAIMARVDAYGLKIAAARVATLISASVFMMQMWLPVLKIVNIPSWSLSIESFFYLVFPLLGVMLYRLGRRAAIGLMLTMYLCSIVLSRHMNITYPDHPYGLDLLSYTAVFSIGILVARWEFLRRKDSAGPISERLSWLVLFLCSATFLALVYVSPQIKDLHLNLGLLLSPVFAALVWILASGRTVLHRLLSVEWLVVLGEASYGLYLLHAPVLHCLQHYGLAGAPIHYPLYISLSVGLSVFSFYFIEVPSRQWIRKSFHFSNRESIEVSSDAQ
jgi:peptidoglycan/LPS O-acetylase OafA/YrhL